MRMFHDGALLDPVWGRVCRQGFTQKASAAGQRPATSRPSQVLVTARPAAAASTAAIRHADRTSSGSTVGSTQRRRSRYCVGGAISEGLASAAI
jgi:hypothetical protein